ncbi:hypothetical protein T01_8508 [Trichinella spiralis]|uniref:Uncharacterized protein n=1 Tax=Trichinella spiralis TaxID=6334 RepID=A0A0V1BPD3_TRISP|nr:hypothetical protein T01_8508 [Trichinella spiralis]
MKDLSYLSILMNGAVNAKIVVDASLLILRFAKECLKGHNFNKHTTQAIHFQLPICFTASFSFSTGLKKQIHNGTSAQMETTHG